MSRGAGDSCSSKGTASISLKRNFTLNLVLSLFWIKAWERSKRIWGDYGRSRNLDTPAPPRGHHWSLCNGTFHWIFLSFFITSRFEGGKCQKRNYPSSLQFWCMVPPPPISMIQAMPEIKCNSSFRNSISAIPECSIKRTDPARKKRLILARKYQLCWAEIDHFWPLIDFKVSYFDVWKNRTV